jgi:hypothetical protein
MKRYWGQWESLKVMGGVLYRKFEMEDGRRHIWQVIMPPNLRKAFLMRIHDDKVVGHLGMEKTRQRVQARAYWFKWRESVNSFCRVCDLCASRKPPQRKPRARMQQFLTGVPLERVSLDVLGPLPKSDQDNKFILLICDYFTKWVEAFPMPNQEAKTVAEIFVKEFVCRYGTPRQLHSDQGSNFQSDLFKKVCQMLEIDKSRTTPYHPQSIGLVERMNRTIEAMLSMFTSTGQRDWDNYLPYIMMAYRSAVQETTGYSPNQMMLGREAELPIDIVMGYPEEDVIEGTHHEYVDDMKQKMTLVHDRARENIKLKSDKQKRYYDLKAQPKGYEPGEAVWLLNPARKKGVSPKLTRPWEGPYLIVHKLSSVTYRIQKSPKAKMKVVHYDRLKKYKGENPPLWHIKDNVVETVEVVAEDSHREHEHGAENDETILYDYDGEETILYNYNEETDVKRADSNLNENTEVKLIDEDSDKETVETLDLEIPDKRSKRIIRKPMRYRDDS